MEKFASNATAAIGMVAEKFGISMEEIEASPERGAVTGVSEGLHTGEQRNTTEVFYADARAVVALSSPAPEMEFEALKVKGKSRMDRVTLPSLKRRLEAYERDCRAGEMARKRRGVIPLSQSPSVIEKAVARDPYIAETLIRLRERDNHPLDKQKPQFKKTKTFRGTKANS